MNTNILETEKLIFSYLDGTKALDSLSVRIPAGRKIAVMGRNGAGKSTLFLHFNGINRPDSGQIKYRGQPLQYGAAQIKELRKRVGLVFQDPDNQLFSASVYQDVSFGPLNLGWPEAVAKAKVAEALQRVGAWKLRDKPVHFLSYGEKKRVALAGVLAMEPDVLVLDEPTSGLDPATAKDLLALLDELNGTGTTIIISSHNIDEVYAWADGVYILEQGKLIAQGEPGQVFADTAVLTAAKLSKPWVMEVYESLLAKGIVAEQAAAPRTREALLQLLGSMNNTSHRTGAKE